MDADIDMRSVMSFLRRQVVFIAGLWAFAMLVATSIIVTLPPRFTATTLVSVDAAPRNLLAAQPSYDPNSDARIEGEIVLARSENVLLSVIDAEQLTENAFFGPTVDEALDKLADMISVTRHRGTYLMSIAVSAPDPDLAARLANAVARTYVAQQLDAKIAGRAEAGAILSVRLAEARNRVIETDGAFDRYIDDHLATINEQAGNPELDAISLRLEQLAADRQAQLTQLQRLRATPVSTGNELLSAEPASQMRAGFAGAVSTAGVKDAIAQAESRLLALQGEVSEERKNLRAAVVGSSLPSPLLTELYDVQQQAQLARDQYDLLQSRSEQLQSELSLQVADSRVVSPALRPGQASSLSPRNLLLLAALCTLAAATGIALLLENVRGGLVAPEQLARLAKTRLALAIPKARIDPARFSLADQIVSAPLSAYAEAVRRLRASLENRPPSQKGGTLIAVTSASTSEGKTTTALALARSYALAGRKALLIDCDLRHPAMHQQLGLTPAIGLADALEANDAGATILKAMLDEEETGLRVLIGSRPSTDATDRLVNGVTFDELLRSARRAFEVVILDTPPVSEVVDTLLIARKADSVVFLVNWATTSRQSVRQSLLALEEVLAPGSVLLPVLNNEKQAASSYGRREHRYFAAPPASDGALAAGPAQNLAPQR